MKRHRLECAAWRNRDAGAIRRGRFEETSLRRFGTGNVARSEAVRGKTKETVLARYGAEHVFGTGSSLMWKVQKGNRIRKARRRAEKRAADVAPISVPLGSVRAELVTTWAEAREFMNSHHYAGFGRSPKAGVRFSLNGEAIGFVKFATVVRPGVATSMGLRTDEVLELDRFCIRPDAHAKNLASRMMSMAIREVRRSHPWVRTIVSFADSAQDHSGGIYRASNWEEVGRTAPSYVYLDSAGETINKKTVYNRAREVGKKEREYAEAEGLTKMATPYKTKFRYDVR
jgi:GNAT superfamily N-acetyltransferase